MGNIVRDELGFETKRGGQTGNYLVLLSSDQIESLKERYEIVEQKQTTSASSVLVMANSEHAELTELEKNYLEEAEQL